VPCVAPRRPPYYLSADKGIKDFDVWSFYAKHEMALSPIASIIFSGGTSGRRNSADTPTTRRPMPVGVWISSAGRSQPGSILTLRRPFAGICPTAGTTTAKALAAKAVILIDPTHRLDEIAWPVAEHMR
jgi:hypothetical protein